MVLKRGMNRKGLELFEWIIIFALVIGGAIIFFLWYNGVFGTIGSATNSIIPSDLEFLVQGCILAGKGLSTNEFCHTFKQVKDVNGKDFGYISCQYGDVNKALQDAKKAGTELDIPNCGNEFDNIWDWCNYLSDSGSLRIDTRANRYLCSDFLGKSSITITPEKEIKVGVSDQTKVVINVVNDFSGSSPVVLNYLKTKYGNDLNSQVAPAKEKLVKVSVDSTKVSIINSQDDSVGSSVFTTDEKGNIEVTLQGDAVGVAKLTVEYGGKGASAPITVK